MATGQSISKRLTRLCLGAGVLLISVSTNAIASPTRGGCSVWGVGCRGERNLPQASRNVSLSLKPVTLHSSSPPATPLELLPRQDTPPVTTPPTTPGVANPVEEIRLVIRLRRRRVFVYRGSREQTSFPIAIGKAGWETPTGTFKVLHMERDPSWEHPWNGQVIPPGPNNPLGTRWIGFWTDGKNYIGFHGTPNERSVGQAASHGCIRMLNRDVAALFEMVKVGTPVVVER